MGYMSRTKRMSRRGFLGSGGALMLLATSPSAWARSAMAAGRKGLHRSRFESLVGAHVRMTGPGGDLRVVLSEVGDLIPKLEANDPNRFALLFTAARDHRPSSGIHTFTHHELGQVSLFVSPVDRGVHGLHYEAVINRSRS
jgi:hypothetical protein